MRSLFRFALLMFTVVSLLAGAQSTALAQEVHAAPGQFDYYLLNLSWAPEFCHNVQMLPDSERFNARRQDASQECSTPHGFVLHGMWPQNYNGTWPANCSTRAGLNDYTPYLSITPSVTLLQHEWSKHGTCTTLSPQQFFNTAKAEFLSVKVPPQVQNVDHMLRLKPDDILAAFYDSNPSFPQGSVALSCGRNYLTAVEVCLSKDGLKPIACQNVHSCGAHSIRVAPETGQHSIRVAPETGQQH